ncbi:hypothetical protein WJX79_002480 [Trebouxia sp. C0005]
MTTDFASALVSRNYSAAIKHLDAEIKHALAHTDSTVHQLLCNRAYCYEQLQLHRRAFKDYEEAIKESEASGHPSPHALVQQGLLLHRLKKGNYQAEAQKLWQQALTASTPYTNAGLVLQAHKLLNHPSAITAALYPDFPQQAPSQAGAIANGISSGQAIPATPSQPIANGTVMAAPQQGQPHTPSQAPARARMPDPSAAIGLAVTQINAGKLDEADKLLTSIIDDTDKKAPNLGAHVARGTARALRRELQGAIEDFTVAVEQAPFFADGWKRRGQARSALGHTTEALEDLQHAIDLSPDTDAKAECHTERGMTYQKMHDFARAVKDLKQAVKFQPKNLQAWNLLGLCQTSMGDIGDGIRAYQKVIDMQPDHREAWVNMAQARKELGHVTEAEAAFKKALSLDDPRSPGIHAMRVLAQMKQGLGDHWAAIRVLSKAIDLDHNPERIQCLFLRGACQHALGYHDQAVHDYEKAFSIDSGNKEQVPDEARSQQFLAFYQKEHALYIRKHLDDPVLSFCLDKELHPIFKEQWCKKAPPTHEMILRYVMQPPFPSDPPRITPADKKQVKQLIEGADAIGAVLVNRHQGFLPNKRQLRMGGLAALEMAQTLRQLVVERQAGKKVMVDTAGASLGGFDAQKGQHEFSWRDAMDIPVRWRQISEPNDQVIWVDLLTKAEFEAGFGSHTPMFSGQTKCVRYYMNFGRALRLMKEVIAQEGHTFDANNKPVGLASEDKQAEVQAAQTAGDMWKAIGKDSWVVVPIASTSRPGHTMEGTRLTIVKVPSQPDAYEFSIRTPVTPPRWRDFDQEFHALWELLLEALTSGNKPQIAHAALTYAYYWYNFMPLARGTAVTGYITLLAIFLAADMPITSYIPKDYQVDWEAILARSPTPFIQSVSSWLYPPAAKENPLHGPSGQGLCTDSLRAEVELPGSSAPPGGISSDVEGDISVQNGDVQGSLTSGSLCSDGVATAQADTKTAKATSKSLKADADGPPRLPDVATLLNTMRKRLEALNGPELPRI